MPDLKDLQSHRLQSVELRDISNNDWEDIAIVLENGVSYIYLADTGNNCECRWVKFEGQVQRQNSIHFQSR